MRVVRRLKAQSKGILQQCDIYYKVTHGRLMLRIINKRSAELIFYNRPNKKGCRYSDYFILPVSNTKLTNELCSAAFGHCVVVKKKCRLFLYKNPVFILMKCGDLDRLLNLKY
jgi:adenylate cyclase class IV